MPISSSYFSGIHSVPKAELDNYYLSFHEKKGFDFDKKRYSVGFISKAVTFIVRVWRIVTGHSYSFESNIKKFAECIQSEGVSNKDLKACVKASKRLTALVDAVLTKKNKSPLELTTLLQDTNNALL